MHQRARVACDREIQRLGALADEATTELLHLLRDDAPGTLLHAQNVANLIEDLPGLTLVHRRAALLHDIGKLCAPEAFSENNHIRSGPCPDASLLLRHVVFGLQLASHYDLDQVCVSAISEHHGTLRLDMCTAYPGPAPQSTFTAGMMIADCYEAVSAQGALTSERAKRLLKARVRAGQFNAISTEMMHEIVHGIWQQVVRSGLV